MSEPKCHDIGISGNCNIDCPVLHAGLCDDPPVEAMVEEIERLEITVKAQGEHVDLLTTHLSEIKVELATAQAALNEVSPFFKAEDRPYDEGKG